MSFFDLLTTCNDILTGMLGGVPDILSFFTSSLGQGIVDSLQLFYDFPLIGGALEDIVSALFSSLYNINLLSLMFGALIPTMLGYSFVKWLVGIVTGS